MTVPLREFPEHIREKVARRRASQTAGGLGKVSAIDFLSKKKSRLEVIKEIIEVIADEDYTYYELGEDEE